MNTRTDPSPRFASDNAAGAHPAVLEAMVRANAGVALAYGEDPWTARAQDRIRTALGMPEAAVFLVFGGTGANVLALRVLASRVEAVLCADGSHLIHAETGAPYVVGGNQLVPVPTEEGRVTPDALRAALPDPDGDHRTRPSALSVANATESGTVYDPEAMAGLVSTAHELGLSVHVDGARLMHAAAAQGVSLAALTGDAGVDVVSLGGTKNGMVCAEAVVVRDPARARDAGRHRKQVTQLPSKARFVAAQFDVMLQDGLWAEVARAACGQARRLAAGVDAMSGVRRVAPVEINAVFVALPHAAIRDLLTRWTFEVWDHRAGVVRWMTAFDTTDAEVDALLADVRATLDRV